MGNFVTEAAPVLSASNIGKSYMSGSVQMQVLKGISVELYTGELTIILGPSGSGKSTFLATLAGLVTPDDGTIHYERNCLNKLSSKELEALRLQYFGFVFQGFNLFSSLTAFEQVAVMLEYCGFNEEEVQHRATKALQQVGLEKKAHLKPRELSGGEKQRVAIARATAKSPDVLFADEPTSSLDTENTMMTVELLKMLVEHNNTAIVLVTHDNRLMPYAQRIILLEDGKITSDKRQNV